MKHFPFPLYLNTPTWCLTDGDCADALLGVPIKYTAKIQMEGWKDTFFFFGGGCKFNNCCCHLTFPKEFALCSPDKAGEKKKRGKKKRVQAKGTFRKKPMDP